MKKNKKDEDKDKDKYTQTQHRPFWFIGQFSRPHTDETLRSPRTPEEGITKEGNSWPLKIAVSGNLAAITQICNFLKTRVIIFLLKKCNPSH